MQSTFWRVLALFGMALSAPEGLVGSEAGARTLVAEGPFPVTAGELDKLVGDKLIRLRTEEYRLKRHALEEHLATLLLAREASTLGVSVEELLRSEVEGKARGVTPEEIQSVYETATDRYAGLGEGQAKERIADGMRRQRIAQRRTVYLAELRARAGVRIALEPPRVQVEVGDEIVRGAQNAPVTVVLYSDFQCPFCARARSTVEDLTARYKEKVRVVFRNYPLPMHTDAGLAAEAALCAHEQGQFWQMHDALFAHQNALSPADLRRYAGDIGLKEPSFSECLASRRHEKTWQATTRQASDLGIVSTPTFLVNGRLVAGAVPMSVLAEIVDDELVRSGAEPSRQHGGS